MVEFWRTYRQIRGWEVDVMENFKVKDWEKAGKLEDLWYIVGITV